MEEEKRPPEQQVEQTDQHVSERADEKRKRPRNIVTDFYDSINISVRQLDIALVVLCAFILLVIIFASKAGL